MYEMYPDTWHVAEEGHHDSDGKPRRRVRKEHPVDPAVLGPQRLVPELGPQGVQAPTPRVA